MQNKKQVIFICLVATVFGVIYFLHAMVGALLFTNNTLSAPQGIYMRVPGTPEIGDFVIAKLPIDIPEINEEKGAFLIKTVQGTEGSQYMVTKDKLIIRNKEYPITYKKYLPQLPKGLKRVEKGHYLLLNEVFNSLDSRYLGEFSKDDVVTKTILVFEYKTVEDLRQKIVKWFTSPSRSVKHENM